MLDDIHLRLASEQLISESELDPTWGHHCFPQLSRLPDGRILLSYHVADDHMDSYGESGWAHQASSDEGEQWQAIQGPYSRFHHHLKLPSGELISVPERAPFDISGFGMRASKHITFASYDNQYYPCPLYPRSELPQDLQALPVWRWSPETKDWSSNLAPVDVTDSLHFAYEGRMPLIYFGELRQFPDGEIVAAFYPNISLAEDDSYDPKQSVALYASSDEGRSWTLRSRIRYQPDLDYDPLGDLRGGFTEPSITICADGSLLCALRCTDATPGMGPLYLCRSTDRGKTWTAPAPLHPYGVMPHFLKLDSGMLLLCYGRPGVQVRLSPDGSGQHWTAPRDVVEATRSDARGDSCGYSALVALENNAALIAYSRFQDKRHRIYVRRIELQPLSATVPLTQALPEEHPDAATMQTWNGKDFHHVPEQDGSVHGVARSYYSSGALASKTPLNQGVINGTQRYYFPEGGLMKECSWKDEVPHGARRLYDRRGNVTSERVYIQGKVSTHEAWWDSGD